MNNVLEKVDPARVASRYAALAVGYPSTSFQSTNPFPMLSSSTAMAMTFRVFLNSKKNAKNFACM